MPNRKKSSTSQVEVLDDNPWLATYEKMSGGRLEEGEITIRGFADLMNRHGNRQITRNAAKAILTRMCQQGLAECVGKKVVSQNGTRPSLVAVYRLTDAKT